MKHAVEKYPGELAELRSKVIMLKGQVDRLKGEKKALVEAGKALYYAGTWEMVSGIQVSAADTKKHDRLWANLRDAMGIEPGTTERGKVDEQGRCRDCGIRPDSLAPAYTGKPVCIKEGCIHAPKTEGKT